MSPLQKLVERSDFAGRRLRRQQRHEGGVLPARQRAALPVPAIFRTGGCGRALPPARMSKTADTRPTIRSRARSRSGPGADCLFLAPYAFAKSIDNLSSDVQGFSSQDPNNNNGEKGLSDYDVKYRWVTSANYALPWPAGPRPLSSHLVRGWEVGSIVTVQSGLPFTPTIATDPANTGTSLRPDRIGAGRWTIGRCCATSILPPFACPPPSPSAIAAGIFCAAEASTIGISSPCGTSGSRAGEPAVPRGILQFHQYAGVWHSRGEHPIGHRWPHPFGR